MIAFQRRLVTLAASIEPIVEAVGYRVASEDASTEADYITRHYRGGLVKSHLCRKNGHVPKKSFYSSVRIRIIY